MLMEMEKITTTKPLNQNKMTAVEWLVEQLMPKVLTAEQYYHIEKAKEMEKEQIKDAYLRGIANYDPTFKSE